MLGDIKLMVRWCISLASSAPSLFVSSGHLAYVMTLCKTQFGRDNVAMVSSMLQNFFNVINMCCQEVCELRWCAV